MASTISTENDSHVYDTRLRGRLHNIEKKYDDIFSAVFKKASSCTVLDQVKRKTRVKSSSICVQGNRRFALYSRIRSASECDSTGVSDASRDTDSSGSQSPIEECFEGEESPESVDEPPSVKQLSITKILQKYNCHCGRGFSRHSEIHEHIFNEHASSSPQCSFCHINIKAIRNNYVCRICQKFVHSSMEQHLRSHYQDRRGQNAFMECRCCYRIFKTISEVREHEKRSHFGMRSKPQGTWSCDYCHKNFSTRHNRDAHLVTHVNTSVGGIWEKIAQMQELLTDQTLVNQCPICDSVMGSRKSFRLHVIHKHLLRDPTHFITSMGLPTVTEVLKAIRVDSDSRKMEVDDTEFQSQEIKLEPMDENH